MAINLNDKPKVMFNLPAFDFYILAGISCFTLLIAVNLIPVIGIVPAFIIVILIIAPLWVYFKYKNILAPGYFINMIIFYTNRQRVYLPKNEINYDSELFKAVIDHNKNEENK